MKEELIKKLKRLNIIYKEPVKLKNAGTSNFYVDVKKAYGYPDVLNLISEELWKMVGKGVTCIATAGYGGLSPATIISSRNNLHLTLVRDKPKNHGKGGKIDGYIPNKHDIIAIVDDVFTTGKSLKEIIRTLKPTGARIIGCYVVVKRGDKKLHILTRHLLTPEELF